MIATAPEINEMETFFASIKLPKVLQLNAAITLNDLPAFVKRTIDNLKNPQVVDKVMAPRWDDLKEIRKLLEANKG